MYLALSAEQAISPPSVFVVGDVVARAPDISWFAARPLFGTRILAAGTPGTSAKLRDRLEALGADVLAQPAIQVTDPPDWGPVDAALDRLDEYDWLVFSSANGVDYLLGRLRERGGDSRRLGRVKLAAIGSGGALALAAARALTRHTRMGAAEAAREALSITAGIDVYTNAEITVEEL